MEEAGLDTAIEVCRARIERAPDDPGGYLALAELLLRAQRPGVVQVLGEAMARGGAARLAAAPMLAGLLAGFNPQKASDRLERDLLACLETESVDPQQLARVSAAALLLRPEIPGELGTHPLWVAFLTRCINVHPEMEARLVRARRALAADGSEAAVCAVAIQAFAGEYCWPAGPGEGATGLAETMYRPLAELDVRAGGPLGALLERLTRAEPLTERALAAEMPQLGGEGGAVSAAVRAHYEANPYPRWRGAPASPAADLREGLGGLPGVDADALPDAPLRTLIAGCGTGYEAVDLAMTDPTLAITAIDLSAASLAYAKRMAGALGVEGIEFVQGDILCVPRRKPGPSIGPVATGARPSPGKKEGEFDLIVSTGVLHHLENPADGLAALVAVLRPGGVIRLGLYSARARTLVAAAQALIAAQGWSGDAEGIRAFRAHILALPESDSLAALRGSDDFYSLSGCRDLFFHACEQWFTPPEIGTLVAGAGLRLVAFDAPAEGWEAFEAMHGAEADSLDLALWDAVEAEHPDLFAGMYQFWCQKPGG